MPPLHRGHFSLEARMLIGECYKIGYVLRPHGLKGEVTVVLDPEGPDEIASIETVFIELGNSLVPYFIESSSQNGNKAFVKFEDVGTPEMAEKISKSALYLPKTSRPKSGRGEFYDDEIVGCQVQDKNLGLLGKVLSVEQAGPNKLLVVQHGDKEILIPVNGPFITSVNKAKKLISVSLPEGFTDI
jgi:16S rRNA processing protein RimM